MTIFNKSKSHTLMIIFRDYLRKHKLIDEENYVLQNQTLNWMKRVVTNVLRDLIERKRIIISNQMLEDSENDHSYSDQDSSDEEVKNPIINDQKTYNLHLLCTDYKV